MLRGTLARHERPVWEPLLELLGLELVDDGFMWMGGVELETGLDIYMYKHFSTRRYLHLSADGRTFAFHPPSFYEEITVGEALAEVFTGWDTAMPGFERPELVEALLEQHGAVPSQERH